MKNLKAGVSIGRLSNNTIRLSIQDDLSRTEFVELTLSFEEFAKCVTGCYVNCEMEVYKLERVGKKQEMDTFTFKISKQDKEAARTLALALCPEGWTPDLGFNSQDSFKYVATSEGSAFASHYIAKTTIRRWVDLP